MYYDVSRSTEYSSQGLFLGLRTENLESFVWIFQSQRFDRSQSYFDFQVLQVSS